MTVGELFKRQSFEKDAKKVFRFTDCYGITWKLLSHPDSIRSDLVVNNFCELTSDFPCEVYENGEVSDYHVYNQQLVFNLDLTDLKNIPSNVISTFDEIYTEPAKKSSGENAIVCQHLQVYKNTKPGVWFKQIVYLEDANGQYGKFEFVTDSITSYDVAVNGSFSHLFVEKVERLQFIDRRVRWNYFDPVPDNNSIVVTLRTSANDRFNKKDRERKCNSESNTKCEHIKPEAKCRIQSKHIQDKEKPKRSALNFDNIITTICVILFLCAVGSIVLAIALWNATFALVGITCSLTFVSILSQVLHSVDCENAALFIAFIAFIAIMVFAGIIISYEIGMYWLGFGFFSLHSFLAISLMDIDGVRGGRWASSYGVFSVVLSTGTGVLAIAMSDGKLGIIGALLSAAVWITCHCAVSFSGAVRKLKILACVLFFGSIILAIVVWNGRVAGVGITLSIAAVIAGVLLSDTVK